MAYVNEAPEAALESTYNALLKYVKQYITNSGLKSRFDVFEREAVEIGEGIETNVVLAATNLRETGGEKAEEHAVYKPKVFTLVSTQKAPYQYGVTVDEEKLSTCVGNEEALRKYAAELTESLYQGWIAEKNAKVGAAINAVIITQSAPVAVPIGDGGQAYADALLMQIKATVEDFYEGVTGTSYGNPEIGASEIAADDVVIVMSNATAALLDTYGYSKAFNESYLETRGVKRVTSSRVPENQVLITDSRNIILHKRRENLVDIQNSDGSHNIFHNVYYFIDVASNGQPVKGAEMAFPVKLIAGTEATAASAKASK